MLHMLGKDPNSGDDQSPTVFNQLDVPEHETIIEFPKRMLQFFPDVNGG